MSDAPVPAPPAEAPLSPRSRAVYVAIALLAGPFGTHNFYAGRWLRGALQLVCAAPALWMMEAWMKEIQPLAETLAGGDPASAIDGLSALAQTGLPDSPLLLGLVASTVWAAADLFLVKTDGKGRRLR